MVENFKHCKILTNGAVQEQMTERIKNAWKFYNYLWMHFEMGNAEDGKGM